MTKDADMEKQANEADAPADVTMLGPDEQAEDDHNDGRPEGADET